MMVYDLHSWVSSFPLFDKIGKDSLTLNKYDSLNILDMRVSSG